MKTKRPEKIRPTKKRKNDDNNDDTHHEKLLQKSFYMTLNE